VHVVSFILLDNWNELFFFLALISDVALFKTQCNPWFMMQHHLSPLKCLDTIFTAPSLCEYFLLGAPGEMPWSRVSFRKVQAHWPFGVHGMMQNLAGKTAAKQKPTTA
jgi:hypothetical protein